MIGSTCSRLPLAQLKVDVLFTAGMPASHTAQQASATIPIVMAHVSDPLQTPPLCPSRQLK
jgi:ABC-type uncharacterized transport system substrate-binding protein